MDNIIFIEFYNKDRFPYGKWSNEPDICRWFHDGMPCLAIRDMSIGTWKGFVGVDSDHPFYSHPLDSLLNMSAAIEIFLSVHGGICTSGVLPPRYSEFSKNYWWLGIDTSHGGDLLPLIKNDPGMASMVATQSYKDFKFIRLETNKLANQLSKLK